MPLPERDAAGKLPRRKKEARPQSFFQEATEKRLGIDKQQAQRMGIPVEDYRKGLHSDLGGEDWRHQLPKGEFSNAWVRATVDARALVAAEEEHKNRPLTQQEEKMKEYDDMLAGVKKKMAEEDYSAQQRALGGNEMISNVGLSGPPLTAEDALQGGLTAAQLSPYWKAASAVKFGYDIATGKAPSWWDAGLAAVGYGSKTKIGKGAVDTLKSLWGKTPHKKAIATGTLPFFASEAKPGAYPKEGFRPEPVGPQPIDHGRGTRDQIDRVRRQTMLR